MKHTDRGLSLMELLVVMLSMVIVGSMAFQLLWESNQVVARNLSQSTKADRLRILQKYLNQDLSSAYPDALTAGTEIAPSSGQGEQKTLLRTHMIEADPNEEPALFEVAYSLEEYPEGSGRRALIRTLDPDLSEGRGEDAQIKPIFSLEVGETFEWEVESTEWRGATSPAKVRFNLTNSRFKDFQTHREILVHGVDR